MHFPTALSTLSAFGFLSTSVMAVDYTTFVTWNNATCNGDDTFTHRYERVLPMPCAALPDARSIKVFEPRNGKCKVNTFSGPGCSGSVTSYTFEADNAPCRRVDGKVSYTVTCSP